MNNHDNKRYLTLVP